MSTEILEEEFEVLESIYPTELTKLSKRSIQIDVEPEEAIEGADELKILFKVDYPDSYPDVLPIMAIESSESELDEDEATSLIDHLKAVGEENIGMAMTFTLVSYLRELLLSITKERLLRRQQEEKERERLALEEEEKRTKGTPVTIDSFKTWRIKFNEEMTRRKTKDEDEKLKALTPKEREEYKRLQSRLSGKQLFERDRNLASSDDTQLFEEGTESVDVSQFERNQDRDDDELNDQMERLEFSDSD